MKVNRPGTFHYLVDGKPVRLEPVDDVIAVRYREPAYHPMRERIAESVRLRYKKRFEVPGEKYTVYQVPLGAENPVAACAARLETHSEVARSAKVFSLRERRVLATDRILFRLLRSSPEQIARRLDLPGDIAPLQDGRFVMRLREEQDPLETARIISMLDGVAYAEPDFLTIGKNPRLGSSGGFRKLTTGETVSSDLDWAYTRINAPAASRLRQGSSSIRIAILDDGVDLSHPDLSGAVVGAYDAITDTVFDQPNPWDGHGTACAGLACGTLSHARGIRGTGHGCSLLAIRIAHTYYRNGAWVTSTSSISRGIDWAVHNDASVLSNSWGGGAPSNAIIESFNRARTTGRSNRGCVIVVAAGNDSGEVGFPGNLSGVLTVSGTNEFDEFKTRQSRDGETWWGSNFGPEVSVAAPSVHIRTTDIVGPGGFGREDYLATFNGTSAAVPLVAGLAGLILSVDETLDESAVRRIICETSDKVGGAPYADGKNEYYGFGRVNALRAIERTLAMSGREEPAGPPPDGVAPAVKLHGSVGRVNAGGNIPAYALKDGDRTYLLRAYDDRDLESVPVAECEKRSLDTLHALEGRDIDATCSSLQTTPYGDIAWGIRTLAGKEEPPPGEIRLGNIEDSVFD